MRFHAETWIEALVSPVVVFSAPVLYVFGTYLLAGYMVKQEAFQVNRCISIYNAVQILVCLYMVYGLMPCIGFPNLFGINSPYDARGEWFCFVHYLSKYLDWFDTLWMVLKKNRKQLSFLHVYHHSTICAVWGYLLYSGVASGTIRYGAWINSLTHVIMYSHYLWTSFGLKNPFKNYITGWQIGQFYSCLLHAFLVRAIEENETWKFAWLQIVFQVSMLYLFTLRLNYVPDCTPEFSASGKPVEELDTTRSYIVIRGEAYDVTDFKHPGGFQMLELGIGRDATVMFESAHFRSERAEHALKSLQKSESVAELEKAGLKFDRPKENWATPAQSELYTAIKKRVRDEILTPEGVANQPDGIRGVPAWHFLTVLASWLLAATWFVLHPSILSGMVLGWTICWIGLAIQHTSNHGGLVRDPRLGYLLGLLNDIAPGGSSLVWRYHHQVSHHAYCNDVVLDQDAHSSNPMLRLDESQKLMPHHKWQWIYGPLAFCFLAFSIHIQDVECLLSARTFMVHFKGTSSLQVILAFILKIVHFSWLYIFPAYIHGLRRMILPWAAVIAFGGFCLSALFIISHNILESKGKSPPVAGKGDWAAYQIETSTSWGGPIGSFMTGGLNLQIEHHLFPCLPHHLYSRMQPIIKEECVKRNVKYQGYDFVFPNFLDHVKFLYALGNPDKKSD